MPTAPLHEQLAKQVTPLSRLTENVLSAPGRLPKRPKFAEQPPPNDAYINVFIEFFPEQPGSGSSAADMERVTRYIQDRLAERAERVPAVTLARRNFLSATVPVSLLPELDRNPAIAFVHPWG